MMGEAVQDRFRRLGASDLHCVDLTHGDIDAGPDTRLPYSLRILIENLVRHANGELPEAVREIVTQGALRSSPIEMEFHPARVLMQDYAGLPAILDLAALREACVDAGVDPAAISPRIPAELVIDHSIMVDHAGARTALQLNEALEYDRNSERYRFLKWAQSALPNVTIVPPGKGIVHQINIEYLTRGVMMRALGENLRLAYPDTLVGTDSHTTMVNGLGVLGWGVGGIEAGGCMLGAPTSMLVPEVYGIRLVGTAGKGVLATDIALTVTERLREAGVVGKFVEFFGAGALALSVFDRVTIANMAPEYGATCGFFPTDARTIDYMRLTGRNAAQTELVETYCREQGFWADDTCPDPDYAEVIEIDLGAVGLTLAGPKRPNQRTTPSHVAATTSAPTGSGLSDGDIVIAAITSCTNTSNPEAMITAGLIAKRAIDLELRVASWVKTSLAPGSLVVARYLARAGLLDALETLGFNIVGFGCTTCVGNSGDLSEDILSQIRNQDLNVCSVLSGNRNFEGRIHAAVKSSYLCSPPAVVLYALAGTMSCDVTVDPVGHRPDGTPVYLAELWPSHADVAALCDEVVTTEQFQEVYEEITDGGGRWDGLGALDQPTYPWQPDSTYIRRPPPIMAPSETRITGARPLLVLGDNVTTDHISPVGAIHPSSPAGQYLVSQNVTPPQFNAYGARRGNAEVMVRGTFANVRLQNELAHGKKGWWTRHLPDGQTDTIHAVSIRYLEEGTPAIVIAGSSYGIGSARDWAAKGTALLGVRAVLAESFERIHRANLVLCGVLPIEFTDGQTRKSLALGPGDVIDIEDAAQAGPRAALTLVIQRADGMEDRFEVRSRIDTAQEMEHYRAGGLLASVLNSVRHDLQSQKERRRDA